MSYQVLARKWRPRNFSTLVGQEHVVRALTHALSEQRLHHAYLFTGTRGVGKTTIARILAKSLNCETGITPTPCGACSTCVEIDSGRFVDLLEVDAATNTRVDEMRQLLENAVYAPTRGRFKVYVIDEVHMLSTSAFNAMLKTLEEPPEHVKFILATTDPQKIPVTVLSRCLQFNLKQMPVHAITGHLAHILEVENIPFEASALALIARAGAGSMRDALSLLDQAIAHGAGSVDEAQVRAMLGVVDQGYLFSILESLANASADQLISIASDMALRSLSFVSALQELAALITRIQIAQFTSAGADDDDPDRPRIQHLADKLSSEYLQLAYQIANVGREEIGLAPDEYSGFVMTLLRMHAFRPKTVREVITTIQERGPEKRSVVTPKESISRAPVLSAPVVPAAVEKTAPAENDWFQIVSNLELGGLAKELAQNCELIRIEQELCVLRLAPAYAHLQMKAAQDKLQQSLSDYFQRQVALRIELGVNQAETPAHIVGRERQRKQDGAITAIEQDTFVRDMIDQCDASLVPSSIKPIN